VKTKGVWSWRKASEAGCGAGGDWKKRAYEPGKFWFSRGLSFLLINLLILLEATDANPERKLRIAQAGELHEGYQGRNGMST